MTSSSSVFAKRLATHSDSLVEEKRIAKRPLTSWIEALLELLDTPGGALDPDILTVVQNNLGLILLHSRGHAAAAENCRRQMSWAARLDRADLMVQPLVNLARIDRLTKNAEDANTKLSMVRGVGLGLPVSFEGHDLGKLGKQDREFALNVALVERFHLLLATNMETLSGYFMDPDYVRAASGGGAIFAEQKLQAGLIHGCEDTFRAGLAMINRPTASFAGIVAHYYSSLWRVEVEHDPSPIDRLADGLLKISTVAQASDSDIDHRFLRLLFATAHVSHDVGILQHRTLYESCETLARRLDDFHFMTLARHGLGYPDRQLSEEIAAAGYNALRGIKLQDNLPPPIHISYRLDDLLQRVEEARAMGAQRKICGISLAAA